MSDQPSIIRQDVQHSVTVPEGAGVATSKPSDPHGPQVRQNLVGENATAPADQAPESLNVPPPRAQASEPPATVFERTVSGAGENLLHAPQEVPAPLNPVQEGPESAVDRFLRERRLATGEPVQSSESAAPGPVFERSTQDQHVSVPAPSGPSEGPADGPVFERALSDHLEQVPAPQGQASAPSQGPVFERSTADHFEKVPDPLPVSTGSGQAPVLERAMSDRRVAVPSVAPRNSNAQAPREGSGRKTAPAVTPAAPDPVPLEQAQQLIAETAQAVQQRLEENIGPAHPDWVEMDFPARVVKLKIENDKVRVRLDQLEEMAGPRGRAGATA